MRSARRTVYLYARPKVETSRDYQISTTAEPIELIISLIDSAYSNYIMKVCLFLLYVLYEKSYYNVKCKNKKNLSYVCPDVTDVQFQILDVRCASVID